MGNLRIGQGYDIHALVPTSEPGSLVLAGIEISSGFDCVADSDGDVVCHALIDALLGALAKGDIGVYFPPDREKWKGYKSIEMLRGLYREQCLKQGWRIGNIDITIILEKIRLRPLIHDMRERLAETLECLTEKISVKAKTKEGLDAVGAGNAVEAFVNLLLYSETPVLP